MRIVYEPDGDVLEGSADWAKAVDIDLGAVAHLDSGSRLAAIEIFGSVGDERNGQAGARCSQAAAQQEKLKAVKIGRNWVTTRMLSDGVSFAPAVRLGTGSRGLPENVRKLGYSPLSTMKAQRSAVRQE